MDRNLVAALGFALMFVLLLLRVPIGIAMGISGVLGFGCCRASRRRSTCWPMCRCRC